MTNETEWVSIVVCRQLGFDGLARITHESQFGRVDSTFAMDDVHCTGDETTIQECEYDPYDNCSPAEGAGVICEGGYLKFSSTI